MLERHPDHVSLLIDYFPNLKELDSVNLIKDASTKKQVRFGRELSREVIPLVFRLDKLTQKIYEQGVDFDVTGVHGLKPPSKPSAKSMLDFVKQANKTLIEDKFECAPENRQELFYLFKWMFQEVLITLSAP